MAKSDRMDLDSPTQEQTFPNHYPFPRGLPWPPQRGFGGFPESNVREPPIESAPLPQIPAVIPQVLGKHNRSQGDEARGHPRPPPQVRSKHKSSSSPFGSEGHDLLSGDVMAIYAPGQAPTQFAEFLASKDLPEDIAHDIQHYYMTTQPALDFFFLHFDIDPLDSVLRNDMRDRGNPKRVKAKWSLQKQLGSGGFGSYVFP